MDIKWINHGLALSVHGMQVITAQPLRSGLCEAFPARLQGQSAVFPVLVEALMMQQQHTEGIRGQWMCMQSCLSYKRWPEMQHRRMPEFLVRRIG